MQKEVSMVKHMEKPQYMIGSTYEQKVYPIWQVL